MKKYSLIAICIAISFCGIAQNVPSYVPANGLVAWWPFSGNAVDSSGNGNNGTVNGATLTTDRFGNANSAYYFSSSGCATRIDANVNTTSIQQGLTIAIWVLRVGNGCIGPRLLEFWGNNGPGHAQWNWDYGYPGSPNIIYFGSVTSSNLACSGSINNPSLTSWIHLAYTNDGVNGRFYYNGSLVSTVPSYGNIMLSGNLAIGRMNHPAWDAFNGKMDDMGVWNRALTPCEIQALYTGTPSSFNTNLIAQDTIKACGDSVLVSATSGLSSYAWNTGATTSSIYAKNTGWYKVTGANASGCSATDSVFVSIVKANILNNDTTVCVGTALTLNAQITSLGTACASSGLPNNLQTGLVGYWPFCGNANDMSGNGNNGTVNGATLTTDRFGIANSAYGFNLGNSISTPYSPANITSITYSAWFKTNSGGVLIGSNAPGTNANLVLSLHTNSTSAGNQGTALWVVDKTGSSVGWMSQTPNNPLYNNNVWHQIIGTYSCTSSSLIKSDSLKLFVDGVLITTIPQNVLPTLSPINAMSNIVFGYNQRFINAGFDGRFVGSLDDIAIWNRALSPSEVSQLYQTSSYAPSYLWSTGATTPNINVTPTQTTKYWVKVSNGISSCTDTVTITVQNPSTPATNNVSYCQGATTSALTATANAGNTLRWYTTATGGTFTTTAPTPSTTTLGTTTYYVSQITPQGCESARAALNVTINPLPQATITASKAPVICTGDSVVYTVSPIVAGQTYIWYRNGVVIAGATGTSYAAKQSGVYSVQVFNSFGCSTTSATTSLSVYPWPTVNAGPDKEVPAGTSVDIITQTTNAQSIAWSPVTGLSCISCASPTATVNFPIVYVVTVTSAGGCSVSDTITIRLVCEDNLLYMPNTFTPNGDGENDRFYPMGKGLGEVNVFRIVNRLGQVVYTKTNFSANDASYGWDGTFNGSELGMDVYSYYIEVSCATGQVLKRTGDISLLR